MRDTVWREVGLVVRNEHLKQSGGQGGARIEAHGERDNERENYEGDTGGQDHLRSYPLRPGSAAQCRPSAHREQKLPCERIKVPAARRIRGKIPAEMTRQKVQSGRGR